MKKRTPSVGSSTSSRPVGVTTTENASAALSPPAMAHPVPVPGDNRHSSFPEHGQYTVRVTGRSFCCGVTIRDGRIANDGTAPYLMRMRGMTVAALMAQAEEKGWQVERIKGK